MAQVLSKNSSRTHLSPLVSNQTFNNLKKHISNQNKISKKKLRSKKGIRKASRFTTRDYVMLTKILNPILSIKYSHSSGVRKRVKLTLSRFWRTEPKLCCILSSSRLWGNIPRDTSKRNTWKTCATTSITTSPIGLLPEMQKNSSTSQWMSLARLCVNLSSFFWRKCPLFRFWQVRRWWPIIGKTTLKKQEISTNLFSRAYLPRIMT